MQQKIAFKAQEMFFRFGYSKIALSEVASEMGISKKTIYNHYQSKEELLYAVIDLSKSQFDEQIHQIEESGDMNFREMVMEILSVLGLWVSQLRIFVKDLQRNQPEPLEYLNKIRKDVIVRHAMRILEKGKELERIRDDNQAGMALFIFLATAEKVTDDDYRKALPHEVMEHFPNNPADIFKKILEIIYEGIKK